MHASRILAALTVLLLPGAVASQKLTYRQKQAVKSMTWTVNNVEKTVLPKYRDTSWLGKKAWTVPELNRHINAVNNGFRKLNDAIKHLNKAGCHTGQPEVKALVDRIVVGQETFQKAAAELQAAAKKSVAAAATETYTVAAGDSKTYKDYAADRARAKSIADVYLVHDFLNQADKVREVSAEFFRAAQWVEGREKFYQPFFHQKTPAATQLQRALGRARSVLVQFRKNAQSYIKSAPAAIERELGDAEKYLAEAVAKTKPLFLEGGVKQNLELVDKRLGILEILLAKKLPAWVKAARARHGKIVAARDAAGRKMAKEILAARKAPQDNYNGADKEKLRKLIHTAWQKAYPKDEILGVRLPAQWQRRRRARWVGDAWQFTDGSWIQLRVAVKAGDERVSLYVAYVNKNHLTDAVTTNVATRDDKFHVVQQMLLANWE